MNLSFNYNRKITNSKIKKIINFKKNAYFSKFIKFRVIEDKF